MNNKNRSYIRILEEELLRRKEKNSSYSMRAFSKALEVNSGVLSMVLNGKRVPSMELARKIADKLDVCPQTQKMFFDSVVETQRSRNLHRVSPDIKKYKFDSVKDLKFKQLENDYYHSVSEWYCFTILEMTRLHYFKPSFKWIASQLGISEMEVQIAVKRLLNLGFLEEDSNGGFRAVDEQLRLDSMYTATSQARRNKQKQIREKSIESIENDPIENRSMTSMTMCIDMALLPEARKLISDFNEAMSKLLESGNKEKVYAMEVSLFPLHR